MRFHADLHIHSKTRLLDASESNAAGVKVPLVVSGPGADRVTRLARRIVRALRKRSVANGNCLVIVDTMRTVDLLRAHLDRLLPGHAGEIAIHTLHSFGVAILREHGASAGLNRGFRVACKADQAAIFAEMRGFAAGKIESTLRAISRAKRGIAPRGEDAADALAAYQQGLMLRNLVDRDDLVRLPSHLLEANSEIAARLVQHFPLIFIEPQDLDKPQTRFVRSFAGELKRTVRKDGRHVRRRPDQVTVHAEATELTEAEHVVATIEALLREGYSPGDFAILYRSDTHSSALADRLERAGIRFQRHSEALIADDPTARALFLELYDVPGDEPLPHRLQGAAQRLRRNEPEFDSVAIDQALERLTTLAEASSRNGLRFADAFVLASNVQFFDPCAACVALLSLEAAEGFEFRIVFIVGLEDGEISPDASALAEERRLLTRGMTCALDRLYLSHASRRQCRGQQELSPSPLLLDIETEVTKHRVPVLQSARVEDRQLKLL
jgi:DNA helicase-2/ATP-dependent DNA helicase PcrA